MEYQGKENKSPELQTAITQDKKQSDLTRDRHQDSQQNASTFTNLPSTLGMFNKQTQVQQIAQIPPNPFSNPGRYSGKHPSEQRNDKYHEAQRKWSIDIVKNYAKDIGDAAKRYNVPPEAIAGAILWEGIENPYDYWTRGQGPLKFTRPNRKGPDDYGIPGKIHTGEGEVAHEVEPKIKKQRPGAIPEYVEKIAQNPDGTSRIIKVKTSDLSVEERQDIVLQDDPSVAIEYIAAILDREATRFEQAAAKARKNLGAQKEDPAKFENAAAKARTDSETQKKYGNYPIRDQAGLLTALYQGIKPKKAAQSFEQRRAEGGYPRPKLPDRKDGAMGPWVSSHREWIRELLKEGGYKNTNADIS